MSAGSSVTEIISQFAGYFQLFEEASRSRLEYNEMLAQRFLEDYTPGHRSPNDPQPKVAPFDTEIISVTYQAAHPNLPYTFIHGMLAEPLGVGMPQLDPLAAFNAGLQGGGPLALSAGVLGPPQIQITYGPPGAELVLDANQVNRLLDNDLVGVKEGTGVEELNPVDINAIAQELTAIAGAQVPDGLALNGFATNQLIEYFTQYNAAWAAKEDPHGELIAKGVHVNGMLLDEDGERPEEPERADKEYDNHIAGQIATLGDNVATNAALVVDVNLTMGTLFVGGNYYRTDAIVQTNVYSDQDHVTYGGGGHGAIETGGNEVYNVAAFYQSGTSFDDFELEEGKDFFAGLNWFVEVLEGDFYNVHSIHQQNWLIDNDIAIQDTHQSHYQLVAGSNEQGNFINFLSLAATYDLVVVMGDYHEANLIFQTNLLWDNDVVKVVGAGDGEEGGGTVSTGGNWLINDAIIEHIGSRETGELTEDWQNLIQLLSGRAGEIDPMYGWGLPNFGDDVFNVLFITGSMYDITVVSQLNFVLDADTAIQYLPAGFKIPGDGFIQDLSTGGNSLTNFAAIIKPGVIAGTYVGGKIYEDEMLIQAEIVVSDSDKIVYGDPDALANELVAFTGPDTSQEQQDDVNVNYYSDASNGDLLGNMLT